MNNKDFFIYITLVINYSYIIALKTNYIRMDIILRCENMLNHCFLFSVIYGFNTFNLKIQKLLLLYLIRMKNRSGELAVLMFICIS